MQPRKESLELQIYRILNYRTTIDENMYEKYSHLEKGFLGEQQFDAMVEQKLPADWITIDDLLLEINNTSFQIESLLFSHDKIHVIEVKNFEGDYIFENDR